MKVYQTNEIRNIALIGGARAGKTTFAEAILFNGGLINRRGVIEDKNTVCDYKEIEHERLSSVFSSIIHVEFNNYKINVIDTPGLDDFVGEVCAAMKVADTSVMLVNAQNGVEVGTEISWRFITKNEKLALFVVNQLDHEKANFDDTIRQMQTQFGTKITIAQYPVSTGIGFNSIIDLLSMKMYKYTGETGKPEILDIPESEKTKAEKLQLKLIEAAAESDEALMEKFFEKGTLSEDDIKKGIKGGLIGRNMFPVFCASTKHNIGIDRVLEFIIASAPAPNEMPAPKTTEGNEIKCDANGSTQLFVFKTSIEPHLGEISFFKVTSGALTEAMDLVNANTGSKERISQIFLMTGKNRTKAEKIVAGDIGATIKLKETKTNNTLNANKNSNDMLESIVYPDPKIRSAIKAKNQADDEKLGTLLKEMSGEDPTLIFEQSVELRQMLLHGQGELHLNVAKWHLETMDKVEIEFFAPKIPYRETITKPAKAMYRHKKQSGGAGQFGEVHMMIEPYVEGKPDQTEFPIRAREEIKLAWGGKLMYHTCIVGGAIDARFQPAILKGVMKKIEEGPLTGSYARDIIVSIYDGKMHPVDSNEISFQLAGRNAFREAFKNAGPKILEPIYDVEVLVPSERMGDVMTDLQGRRAIVMGMDSEGNYQKIKARVPLAEMNRYATMLSSLTSGRATYTMKYSDYQQVPADVQDALLKAYAAESKEED